MKKLLTTLLCVTMVICMMPTLAFAEEGSDPAQAGETVPVENSEEETPAAEPDNVINLSGDSATANGLKNALASAPSGSVVVLEIDEDGLTYSDSLSVPAGVTLEVRSGKLTLEKTTTLGNKGAAIQIDKGAEVEATSIALGSRFGSVAGLTVYGKLTTSNSITVTKECTATVSGTVTCNGGITNSGTFSIENFGEVNCQNSFLTNNGTLTVGKDCNLNVTTSLTNDSTTKATIINSGTILAKCYSGGSKGYGNVENYGIFSVAQNFGSNKAFSQTKGTFLNAGTLNVGSDESENAATMTIGNAGVVDCTSGAKLYVKTKLENKGSVTLPENYTPPTDSTNSGTVIVLGENAKYPFDGEEALMASISNAGRTGFSVNLASALTGAVVGDTVTMLQDCKITGNPNVTSPDVTLDLKGNTLTMSSKLNVNSGAKLTVTDSSDGEAGTVNGAFADVSGELVVKDGAFGYTDSAAAAYNFSVNEGKLKVEGGTFTAEKGLAKYNGGEIVIADEEFAFVNTDTEAFDHLPIACYDDNGLACKISLPEGKQISRTVNQDGNGTYTFALTDEQAVASVDGKPYTSLQAAFDAAASGDVVTLLRDTIATEITYAPAGKEIVLDMSGHEYVGLNLVTISPLANSILTVKDNSGENGVLGGTYPISIGRVTDGTVANNAAVILESGANIVAKRTLTSDTVGVAVESRQDSSDATTVTVKDGAQVSGIRAGVELLAKDSVINMEGGNVSCNANWGAVTVGTNGTINISGGSIEGNKYTIVAGTNAAVNITDGTVCGLIYLDGNNSNLEIEGGTFSGKKSDSVQITGEDTAKVTISGGVFEQVLYSSTAAFKPKFTIEAGLFKTKPEDSDLAKDKTTSEVTLDGEDYTSVGNATAGVAKVGESAFYTDIDTAITAANAAADDEDEEATLTILDDVALDENTPEVDSDVKVKVADGAVIDNNSGKELTVTNSNEKEVTVPAGAVLDGNGNVVAGTKDQRPQVNPDGTVTVPAGGTITRPDGKVTEVPAESQVNTAVAYTIIFQDGKASETKVLYAGMALPTPTKSGYTFGGWFTDEACTIAFDIAKAEAGKEHTLYAKWTANSTGYYPATPTAQKPVIETTEGAAAVLDSTGTTATITVADGYELVDVTVNGISKGKVTTLTGLKTGDKVVVTAQKITNADDIAAQIAAVKSVKLVARSQMSKAQGKKAVKITWYATDGSEAELDGVEIFRSTKRYSGYGKKPIFTTTKAQYHNTAVRTGAKYYYKVRGYKVIAGEKVYTDWSTKAWRTVK